MDPSDIPDLGETPVVCNVVAHLQWTLPMDWRTELTAPTFDGIALQPGWRTRASSWRDGQDGTELWVESLDPSQTPSWEALQASQRAAGLNPQFRTGPTTSDGQHYGWYQDLEKRMVRKFDVDGQNEATPLARAIRGFLDIIHTQPFEAGNTRAACTWVVWSLAGVGIDISDLGPVVQLPKPTADHSVVMKMAELLSV